MMIGEHIKKVRNSKNLTQKEMAAGIVNRSFYSRVENGSSSITADNLMKILYRHELSMTDFLYNFGNTKPKLGVYQDRITAAYINKDIVTLKEIYINFKYEDIRIKRLLKFLIDELNGVANQRQFKQLNYIFFKQNKWDEETLWLVFHIMEWYEMSDLQDLIDAVIKKCNCENATDRMRHLIVRVAIKYLDICFKQDNKNKVEEIIDLLKFLPNTTDMWIYKMMAVYYDKIFHHKYDEAKSIVNILKMCN